MFDYSTKQKAAIIDGRQKRNALIRATRDVVRKAMNPDQLRGTFKLDTILSGSTGIGKTYNIVKELENSGAEHFVLQGSQSMFAFATRLMLEHHLFQAKKKKNSELQKLIILVDDCDSFLSNKESMNNLKSMTGKEGSRWFQYNKAIQEHMMTPEMLTILDDYRNPNGAQGFKVNCDDIIFVLTTNTPLPSENHANNYVKKHGPTNRGARLLDLAAIRRRFNTKDFILSKEINWGWIAEVTMNDNLIEHIFEDKTLAERKLYILDWIWNNWEKMMEHNIDTVLDLALHMHESPSEFRDIWEADYIDAELAAA